MAQIASRDTFPRLFHRIASVLRRCAATGVFTAVALFCPAPALAQIEGIVFDQAVSSDEPVYC